MGSIVTAICKCGFHEEIMIGGGMRNYTTICSFPAYCEDCKDLVIANLLENPAICPKCKGKKVIPYDSEWLVERKGNTVATWNINRELILTDGEYYCPKCKRNELTFQLEGFWD